MKEQFIETFSNFGHAVVDKSPEMLLALFFFLVFVMLGLLWRRFVNRRLRKRWKDSIATTFVSSIGKWTFYIIGLAIALYILGFGGLASGMLAGAGLGAIIIGFAFKDIAENFLAGIILAVNRPFQMNDIIEVEGYKGKVVRLEGRSTHLRMPDGRDVFVPNAVIVKTVLTNYTRDGYIRQDFLVGLDTGADVKKARELVLACLSENENILETPAPNVLVDNLGVCTIDLKVLFWINVFFTGEEPAQGNKLETVKSAIMRDVKDTLLENGFDLPSYVLEHKIYDPNLPIPILNTIVDKRQ